MTQLLTVEQAAAHLGVDHKTVRRILPELGALDLLHGRAKKRLIRIPAENLDAYLDRCRIIDAPQRKKTKANAFDPNLFEPDGRIKRRK